MGKFVFRKGLVIGIILLFIGASIIPSISGNTYDFRIQNIVIEEKLNYDTFESNNEVCDWPMFRHDSLHTGYTECIGQFQNSGNLKWKNQPNTLTPEMRSTPAIADIDNDDNLEVIVCSFDSNIYTKRNIN